MCDMFKCNLRNVLCGVCCAAIVMCGRVSGMNESTETDGEQKLVNHYSACDKFGMPWPSMAVNCHEPKMLADLHATREGLGYFCFMPKNQEEMNMLYEHYKVGNFLPYGDPSFMLGSWNCVLINIKQELGTRLKSGDMVVINKFLAHLEMFVTLAANHTDADFIGNQLFGDLGLRQGFVEEAGVGAMCGKSAKYRLTEAEAFYVATRLNEILNNTGRYERDTVLAAYITWKIDGGKDFFESAHGKAITEDVIQMFLSNGLPLPSCIK
jgi:hypothetical protein